MSTCTDFSVGDRVELHPATDMWMRGARFGTVVKIGRTYVHVRLDKLPSQAHQYAPDRLTYVGKADCPTCGARYLEHMGCRVHMRVDCKGWN